MCRTQPPSQSRSCNGQNFADSRWIRDHILMSEVGDGCSIPEYSWLRAYFGGRGAEAAAWCLLCSSKCNLSVTLFSLHRMRSSSDARLTGFDRSAMSLCSRRAKSCSGWQLFENLQASTQAQGCGCALNDKLRSNQSLWQRIEPVGAGGFQVYGPKERKLDVCFVLALNMELNIRIKEYVSPVHRSTNLMDRHTPAFGGLGRSSTYSRHQRHEQRGFTCKAILEKIPHDVDRTLFSRQESNS